MTDTAIYTSPQSDYPGVWRHRSVLVMLKEAGLPPICLKSGEPATQCLRRDLQWREPRTFVTITGEMILSAMGFLILSPNETKQATLMIGLSDDWAARRGTRMMTAYVVGLAGIATGFAGCILNGARRNEGWLWLLPVALVIIWGAALYGKYACRLVWPERITDKYVFLKGVHPIVLDQLPEWLD